MGNADLRQLAAIETVPFETIDGATLAIDAHNWLYRYLTIVVRYTDTGIYTTTEGTEVPNLIGLMQGLPRLLEHDVTPVFVFDGIPSELKEEEIKSRRQAREQREEQLEAAKERGDKGEIARLQSQTQRLTPAILNSSRELLSLLDVPVVDAPAEGEAQAAWMASEGLVDGVGSEDYDTLLFGAPHTYRDLTSRGSIEHMSLQATLETHQISHEQLVDVGILCGTDFNDGVSGFGPKTALKAIREHGRLDAVLTANNIDIPHADRLQNLFLEPPVNDITEIETTITPDIGRTRDFLIEQWELPASEIDDYLERIEAATTQTGLDRWT